MKILCGGDQHWTTRKPKNRTDDYYKTVLNKLQQEVDIAKEEGCYFLLLPGDLFDSFKENHLIVQDIIKILRSYHGNVLCVAGQHDQQYHNPDLKGTALGTLIAADVVTLLTNEPYVCATSGIAFYGSSWKGEIPEITTPDLCNILVLHKMIIEEKLWAEQEGHTWANHMLIKNKFDLIVSGDNHNQFVASKGNKHLVNMGSMMRSTIAQVNHHPAVVVYNSETKHIDIIDLDIKPIDEVMCIEKAEKEKERNKQLDAFVESLSGNEKEGAAITLNFVDALNVYYKKHGIDTNISNIINKALE